MLRTPLRAVCDDQVRVDHAEHERRPGEPGQPQRRRVRRESTRPLDHGGIGARAPRRLRAAPMFAASIYLLLLVSGCCQRAPCSSGRGSATTDRRAAGCTRQRRSGHDERRPRVRPAAGSALGGRRPRGPGGPGDWQRRRLRLRLAAEPPPRATAGCVSATGSGSGAGVGAGFPRPRPRPRREAAASARCWRIAGGRPRLRIARPPGRRHAARPAAREQIGQRAQQVRLDDRQLHDRDDDQHAGEDPR